MIIFILIHNEMDYIDILNINELLLLYLYNDSYEIKISIFQMYEIH